MCVNSPPYLNAGVYTFVVSACVQLILCVCVLQSWLIKHGAGFLCVINDVSRALSPGKG